MSFSYDNLLLVANLWAYMFIYNLSLVLLIFTLLQVLTSETQTLLHFSHLGSTNPLTKILILAVFSMAGVPPFWGFFAKIFLFLILLNSSFFLLFFFFFSLLFIALYFYIQNMRFLNTSSPAHFKPVLDFQLRVVPFFFYVTFSGGFFLIFGFFFTDDLLLLLLWTLL